MIPNYIHGDATSEIDAVDISNSEVEEINYFFDKTDYQDEEIVNSSIFCLTVTVVCVVLWLYFLFSLLPHL